MLSHRVFPPFLLNNTTNTAASLHDSKFANRDCVQIGNAVFLPRKWRRCVVVQWLFVISIVTSEKSAHAVFIE